MAKEETINIKRLQLGRIKVKIIGKTPYMPSPMDMAVVERYDKKKSNKVYEKDNLSEEEKAKERYYYTSDGKKGIPVRAFYQSMIKASSYIFEKSEGGMRNVKEGVTILGDIVPLKYKKETKLVSWGRTSGAKRSPIKIVRNSFEEWSCELEIEYNQNQLSAEHILNILNWAGFHIGVGSFRKEKTGNYGSFSVEV